MKKQVLSGLLVLCLIFSLLPVSAFADTVKSGTCGENLTWTLDSEGTLTISGTGAMTDYINDSKAPWYSSCSSIKSAIIESGVTTIGDYAFEYCSSLASVTILNSVTSIGDYAFCDCDGLTSVTIPDSVTTIGERAFFRCYSLTSVTIPDSVTSVGEYAFQYCSSLASVTIPDSVTSIGEGVFYKCSSLESVTIPDSVTSIGNGAFDYCSSLLSINVDNNNEYYSSSGGVLFDKKQTILICYPAGKTESNYTIPDSVTSIGDFAFSFCSSLASVTIPDSVTSIGIGAFGSCSCLEEVRMSDNLIGIGDGAFRDCNCLRSLTLPSSLKGIGYIAFEYCYSLTNILFKGCPEFIFEDAFKSVTATVYYYSEDNWPTSKLQNYGGNLTWVPLSGHIHDYAAIITAPTCTEKGYTTYTCTCGDSYKDDFIEARGHNCVDGTCTVCGATGIIDGGTCGDNVIWTLYGDGKLLISGEGNMANYHYCDTEYSSVTTAPWGAYEESISSVEITDGVTSIGGYAFCGCSSLESMTIGSNVTSIGDYAFFGCDGLKSIVVASDNKIYSSQDGTLFNKDKTELIQYPIGNTRTSYTIPNSVTSIGNSAFYNCRSLTSVTIPDSVTSIGDKAFDGSENLTSVTMGNGVTSIGDFAFYVCSSLTSVTIPDSVTSIGKYAFCECYSLESITIPDSVTSIEKWTFHNCVSMTGVTIGSGVTSIGDNAFSQCYSLKSAAIPDNVVSIGDFAFAWCYSLESITIGSGITSIGLAAFGDYRNVKSIVVASDNKIYSSQDGTLFNKDKTELIQYPIGNTRTSYTIPNSVTSIGNSAFYNCRSLTSVTIPDSVTSIGDKAFDRSENLTSVTIPDSVTSIGDYAFSDCAGLTSVTIGNSVTSIGDYAFAFCENLTSVTFDGCPNSISYDAFKNVTATVYYYSEDNWPTSKLQNYGGNLTWVPLSKHTHDYTVAVTAPTCTEKGYTTYTCACGDSYVADYKDALGHDFGEWTVTTAPTCTEKGVETRYCSRCDATETREVNALGHSFGEWTVTTAPTCTEKGVETRYCSGCDATETREVDALGHALVHHDGKAVACTEAGWEAYDTCSRCDYTTYKEIPATGHDYIKAVMAPTCTAQGYTTYTCSCGDSYVADYKDALGHSFGEWTQTKAPTCTAKGTEVRTCTRCNATETRDVEALGHNTTHHAAKAATCTEAGWEAYDTCSRCDYTTYKEIPATGHHHDAVVTAPTCTEKGYTTHTCACGDSHIDSYTDALGHSYKNGKCVRCNAADPTYIAAPTLKITTSAGKPQISWNAVDGATKYLIYRSTDGKTFKQYDSTTKTSYTNKSTSIGTTYYYKVKAAKVVNGKNVNSVYSNVKSVKCVPAAPVLKITTSAGKPKISWNAVDGATKYWIYRSTDGKTFKYYDSTTKTSYTNKSTSIGTTYYYKVKAVTTVDGTNYTSDLSGAKSILCKPAAPTVSIYRTNGKPQLKWSAVTGATKYWIYRSTDGKTFKYYDSTTKTSYTNSGAASGKKYYYRVKAVAVVNGTNVTSANSNIKSLMTTLAKPTVSITTSNGKPRITWKAVTGADKYYVYRSTDGKNFSYYDSTTKLSYTNTGAKKNTKYYYKVKAICSANTNANSAYSAVVSIKATK